MRRRWKEWAGRFLLGPWYRLCCLCPVEKGLVVLADGHGNEMPYSMEYLARRLKKLPQVKVVEYFRDYTRGNPARRLWAMLGFMPLYARAEYVFLCDCYVPVSCCEKRKETRVIQLWHSGGLMKRIGRDSPAEREQMASWQHRNYDLFTVSAPCVADTLEKALGVPESVFSRAGVPRMDTLFEEGRAASLRERFLEGHPGYRGKKLVLWAPTFRGWAGAGALVGQEEILRLQGALPEEYALIIRSHPCSGAASLDTPAVLGTEELAAIADILITDYSSLYFDFSFFRRPIVLFAPDLEEYLETVGLYRPYESYPGRVARDFDQLLEAVVTAAEWADGDYVRALDEIWQEQMACCGGNSTGTLLKALGLLSGQEGDGR